MVDDSSSDDRTPGLPTPHERKVVVSDTTQNLLLQGVCNARRIGNLTESHHTCVNVRSD